MKDHVFRWIFGICSFVIGVVLTIVGVALLIICKDWVQTETQKILSRELASPKTLESIYSSIDEKFATSPAHAYFTLGQKNDPKQFFMSFFVSHNQNVTLHITATHVGTGELLDVDVYAGGNKLDNIDLSLKSEMSLGIDITKQLRKSITESPFSQSPNIQKVEFRINPIQKGTNNHVFIEAILVANGMPNALNDGGGE